jgi:hypothetical protein
MTLSKSWLILISNRLEDAPFPDIDLALDEPNGLIAIGGYLIS